MPNMNKTMNEYLSEFTKKHSDVREAILKSQGQTVARNENLWSDFQKQVTVQLSEKFQEFDMKLHMFGTNYTTDYFGGFKEEFL